MYFKIQNYKKLYFQKSYKPILYAFFNQLMIMKAALKFCMMLTDSAMQQEGAKVLIHCYAGISRSAAITIAYLMHSNSMSYEQAYR